MAFMEKFSDYSKIVVGDKILQQVLHLTFIWFISYKRIVKINKLIDNECCMVQYNEHWETKQDMLLNLRFIK